MCESRRAAGNNMAGPAETLSYVSRRLIQFERRFAQSDLARRRSASQLFTQIGASLQSLTGDLARGGVPHDASRELMLYSTRLPEAISEEVGLQEAEKLAMTLGQAADKEKIYRQFHASDRPQDLSEEVEKAAILIQALANGIYMAPLPEEGGRIQDGSARPAA